MERNKKRLLTVVIISFIFVLVSFISAGIIGASMLPYQDPPPDLLEKYNHYVKIYTPIWYFLIVTFFISFIVFLVSGLKLAVGVIKDRKNISHIT